MICGSLHGTDRLVIPAAFNLEINDLTRDHGTSYATRGLLLVSCKRGSTK